MHVTESQDSSEGTFVFNPNGELCLWLAHLITNDPPVLLDMALPDDDLYRAADAILSSAAPVEDIVIAVTDLSRCICNMTDVQRTVLFNYLIGWTTGEIADKLSLTPYVVSHIKRDAATLLRQHYGNL